MTKQRSISTVLAAAIVIVVIIIAGVGAYAYYMSTVKPTKVTPPPTTTKTITISPPNPNELIDLGTFGQLYAPDALDPATGFYVVDEVVFTNVYQGLLTFNGSSLTQLVPVLAQSYIMQPNGTQYVFTMRPNTYFSNLNPINATTAWFSFYRTIVMGQGPAVGNYYPYIATYYGPYFLPYGAPNAVQHAFNLASTPNGTVTAEILSQVLSNFNVHNSSIMSLMTYPNQSIVMLNPSTIEFNLPFAYRYFPYIIASGGWGAFSDPVFVDQHGGVQAGQANSYINTEGMIGSGPYVITSVGSELSSVTLTANPNYWAANAPNVPHVISAPKIQNIVIEFGASHSTRVADFDSGQATMSDVAIPSLNSIYDGYQYKSEVPFNTIFHNVGMLPDLFYVAMNNAVYPTNNTDFRLAVAYSINYSDIVHTIMTFNGTTLGDTYLGPISPGMTYYNPENYSPYYFNLPLAEHYINLSGWQEGFYVVLPNGSTLGNPSAKELSPMQLYTIAPVTPTEETEFEIIQSGLSQIGISISFYPVTAAVTDSWYTPTTTPSMILLGWAPDWPDPVAQQMMALGDPVYGGLAGDLAWFNNSQVNSIFQTLPYELNATQQGQGVAQVYKIMYNQAPYAWMPNADTYWLQQPYLHGVTYNPFVGYWYNLMYYQNYTTTVTS
ncbi:MAG: ABC transporter substrate-binding protein [Thaumarchaeota archaeon]|jgi:ABC-type transport system substrate-binding protein|nr:ABC transporter substrate-binding protein [Nitrososphaerota archaeon]